MAIDRCLRRTRNSLLLSYIENIINENELVFFPFWKYDKFDLENMGEAQCKREFCFLRSHIYNLKKVLNIPKKIVTVRGKRLAFPCRYTDMVPTFGKNERELCLIYNHMLDHISTSPSFAIIEPVFFTTSNLTRVC